MSLNNIKIHLLLIVFIVNFAVSAKSVYKFIPTLIPISEAEIVNPDRGLFRWNGNEAAPIASIDHYQRYNWSALEKSEGVYDFSALKAEAEKAILDPDGIGSFNFAVRCVVEGINHAYPAYLDAKMGSWYSKEKKCWMPDWNNPYFLERLDALVAALGREFNSDPRIGYLEIRSFGNWGEWHLSRFETPIAPLEEITITTIQHMIDAYVKAFPDKQLIMMSDNAIGLDYAMSITGLKYPIGWRRDSWSNKGFRRLEQSPAWGKASERWKTAPVTIEAYGNNKNDFSLALQQTLDFHISALGNGNIGTWNTLSTGAQDSVLLCAKSAGYRQVLRTISYPPTVIAGKSFHIIAEWSNVGVAPVYRNWITVYRICNKVTGKVIWSTPSKIDFRTLLPTFDFASKLDVPRVIEEDAILPLNTPKGEYDLEIIVTEPTNYFPPLKLAIQGRKPNGAYAIGSLRVLSK